MRGMRECNTIPVQNTLNTKVKQIRNPQKEISGGFFCFKIQPSLKKFQQR